MSSLRRSGPRRAALALALAALAAACDGEQASDGNAGGNELAAVTADPAATIAGKAWLAVGDSTPPAQWLASRAAGADVPPSAPAVDGFRDLLARADRDFDETPRMIANRTVQLQDMLAGRGITEGLDSLIEGLLTVGQHGAEQGFGEACQHYFNLRTSGQSRDDALAALQRAADDARR
ncbi:hypothetical protein [Azospirillum sp. ST 5-10]|uniref:hypothetical protein n=1 Tax=unclassified Azospirillum TaxID=2630922 RepID=UPI003F49E4B0